MPNIIAQNHDIFLQRLVEEGRPHILKKYRMIMAKNR